MNQFFIFSVAVVFLSTQLVTETVSQDAEPAQVLVLSIDGKKHVLEAGQERPIAGSFTDAKFKILSAGYRVFRYGGVVFNYPENLEFDSEHDDDDKTWTVSGGDLGLDFLYLSGEPSEYIRSSIEMVIPATDLPKQKIVIKTGKIKIKNMADELKTYEYEIKWDEEMSSHTWAVELPIQDGKSRVFLFSREYENGRLLKECVQFEKMVLGSLKIEK